jgi:ABC-type uncharacterized transport system ATPase subunit
MLSPSIQKAGQMPLPVGICTRAYILSAGAILEAGTPAQIAASEKARAVYLGEKFRLDEQAVN